MEEELANAIEAVKRATEIAKRAKTAMIMLKAINERYKYELKDCINELCLYCGNYSEAHNGACADCRWKQIKDNGYEIK